MARPAPALPGDRAAAERFVLDAVRAYATHTDAPDAPDGDTWLELAESAGVAPTVAAAIAAAGRAESRLTPARLTAAAVSMRVGLELRSLQAALGGLRWAVLKGPILADVVYRTPGARSYDDLDVLVHPGDLELALDRLTKAGFGLIDRNWPMIRDMRRGEISLLGPTGTVLDLHWHLVNDPRLRARLPIDVGAMLRAVTSSALSGSTVPHLGAQDLVVHVAIHAALSGGHRLKWLLDLHQAVRWSQADPRTIGWRARVHGVGPLVRVMLDRVADHIDPDIGRWAEAAAPASSWTQACRLVSRLEPPLGEGTTRRSGRSFFAGTRRTAPASAAALVTGLARDARDRRNHRGAPDEVRRLHTAVDSPEARAQWLAYAATQVG